MEPISNASRPLKALVIGGTGATGREVVKSLVHSPRWSEISVIVRRIIPEWESFDKSKLKIVEVKSLDELAEVEKWSKMFENYDSLFLCLGGRSNAPKEELYKIEYTYAYNGGTIAKNAGFKHCSYIGGEGMKTDSWLYHAKVKAQVNEALQKLKFKCFSLLNPGFLIDRDNDHRVFDKLYKYIPFVPKIRTAELGFAMVKEAEKVHSTESLPENTINIYDNKRIKTEILSPSDFATIAQREATTKKK